MSSLEGRSATEVIAELGLEHLDGEGVWITVLWRTPRTSAIQCLLTPEGFSALHMLQEDETWVHVAGAAVEMVQMHPDGSSDVVRLGSDLDAGEHSAALVPAGSWQGSRTLGEWSLVVCSLAPPFTAFVLAGDDLDVQRWSSVAPLAREFIRD